jgi:hypothetical protein
MCAVLMFGQPSNTLSNYDAAFYDNNGSDVSRLEIFPLSGRSFRISLPFVLWAYAYSPNGDAIYGKAAKDGIFRIELHPVRALPILGSNVFGVDDFTISAHEDRIIISGVRINGGVDERGIFELNPLTGESRILVVNDKPKIGNLFPVTSAWSHIAMSTDGRRLVAMRQGRLEMSRRREHRIAAGSC